MKKNLLTLFLLLNSIFSIAQSNSTINSVWGEIGTTGWNPDEQIDSVTAIKVKDGVLYIGAKITNTSTATVRDKVYKWDGTTWSALGNGFDNRIHAIEIYLDIIYVGGEFIKGNLADATTFNRIAKWDGTTWITTAGANGTVRCMTVGAYTGYLYIGGDFTTIGSSTIRRVARLFIAGGTSYWQNPLSGGYPDGTVYALKTKVSPLGGSDDIYIAGSFTNIVGRGNYNRLAMYRNYSINGSPNWFHFGTEMNSTIHDIMIDSQGGFYATGAFTTANGSSANRIAYWDGSNWTNLGTGLDQTGYCLALDSRDNVIVGGNFLMADGQSAARIAIWDWRKLKWNPCGTGTNNLVKKLGQNGNNIFVGGTFSQAGNLTVPKIAKLSISIPTSRFPIIQNAIWDNSYSYGQPVRCIVKDANGNLYANGKRWNGTTWQNLGSGLGGYGGSGFMMINAMALDASNNLYVTGYFETAGGTTVNGIAKWDGTNWSALGSGIDNFGEGKTLTIYGNTLYVGGWFSSVNSGMTANGIAKYDLTSGTWSSVGVNAENGVSGDVNIAITDNLGNLYLGGNFIKAGTVNLEVLAKWNGSSWSKIGNGLSNAYDVNSLVFDPQGNLYVGGLFEKAGVRNAINIAKWDGVQWLPLENGIGDFSSTIYSLAIDSYGKLWAGGYFSVANGDGAASNIAVWNGSQWGTVKNGFDDEVYSIYSTGNDLFIGGNFMLAGGSSSSFITKLKHCNNTANLSTSISSPTQQEGLYLAQTQITSTSQIQSNVISTFTAGNSITLNPGFKTESNAVFKAYISNCWNN